MGGGEEPGEAPGESGGGGIEASHGLLGKEQVRQGPQAQDGLE